MKYSLYRDPETHGFNFVDESGSVLEERYGPDELDRAQRRCDELNRKASESALKNVLDIISLRRELGWPEIPRARVSRLIRDGAKKQQGRLAKGKDLPQKPSDAMAQRTIASYERAMNFIGRALGDPSPYSYVAHRNLLIGLQRIMRAREKQPKAAAARRRTGVDRDEVRARWAELEQAGVPERDRASKIARKTGISASWVRRLLKKHHK